MVWGGGGRRWANKQRPAEIAKLSSEVQMSSFLSRFSMVFSFYNSMTLKHGTRGNMFISANISARVSGAVNKTISPRKAEVLNQIRSRFLLIPCCAISGV